MTTADQIRALADTTLPGEHDCIASDGAPLGYHEPDCAARRRAPSPADRALPHIADLIDAIDRLDGSPDNPVWPDVHRARMELVAALGVTPPSATTEVWECGPHTNAWNGHDARCRRIRREDVTP